MSEMQEIPLRVSGGGGDDVDAVAYAAEPVEAGSEQAAVPSVGQQLRAAREAHGYSLEEVAGKLKLSTDQIEALESDELSRMHCNAIARGFIRNYARLLGLDAAELMHRLGRSATARENTFSMPHRMNVVVPSERTFAWRDYSWIIAGVFLLLVAVAAYLFLPPDLIQKTMTTVKETFGIATVQTEVVRTGIQEEGQGGVSPEKPAATDNSAPDNAPPASVSINAPLIISPGMPGAAATATPAQMSPTPAQASPVDPAPPPAAAATDIAAKPADAGVGVLRFSFAKPSWVEVKDGSGKVIFSQLNQADSQREVSGQPPLSLLIGNASGVSLSYRGKPVDLSKRSKDDVARVTVE